MKILTIYATAGAGHRKAAEALHERLRTSPDNEAVLVDSLDYTNSFYKKLYSNTYTFLITKIPWAWSILFHLIDIPFLLPFVRLCRRIQNSIHGRALSRYLMAEQFDYMFSTHFFPSEIAAYLKRKGKIKTKIVCSVTDFDVHSIWLSDGIDCYTVASEWTREKLKRLGVPGSQIFVTGIPTDEKFSSHDNISELKQSLELKEDIITVLVATGSFGIGPIEEIINALQGFQIIVVCGHNKKLYERLLPGSSPEIPILNENVVSPLRSRSQLNGDSRTASKELVKICGLVDNMDELMAVADVMITKPGGLSISEALVSGLPLIFFNAIPGQEVGNIKVLKEYGVGISGCGIPRMARILNRFKSSPEEFQIAKEKTKILAKPSAVKDITEIIKD